MDPEAASRRAAMPGGSERFLDSRTLAADHRRLAQLLTPGMSVLDVGCGSGAITRGIAQAVGPTGTVVGIDIDDDLLATAVASSSGETNLTFENASAFSLGYRDAFDVVTAARMLQWLADPQAALSSMIAAVKPGGRVAVLDYSHSKTRWEPEPPAAVIRFYQAFLDWRADAGMDNLMADHLVEVMHGLGLVDVEVTDQTELTRRGDDDFERRTALWPGMIATRGHQLVVDGMIDEHERLAAGEAFAQWLATPAQSQSLYLLSVAGSKSER